MSHPITSDRLRDLLNYDRGTGVLTWRVRRGGCVNAEDVAGRIHHTGYIAVCVDGRMYLAHRLAWLYVTGEWPVDQVEHRNGIRSDNRWDNLRAATNAENGQNRQGAHVNNKSGMLGVSPSRGLWRATINVDGKQKYLGRFSTPEDAHAAYLKAKSVLHPFQTLVS